MKKLNKIRIVCLSDIHGLEYAIKNLSGDILIHAGDMEIQNSHQLHLMNSWFGSLDFKYKICIAGNHDRFIKNCGKGIVKKLFTNAIYLENDGCEIEGIKYWGSPYTVRFNNWAFMYERGSKEAKEIWSKIPEGLDFLITHGPAYQCLDEIENGEHQGCEVMQREIFKKKPKYHVFGHIHSGFGKEKINEINFINCSVLNNKYQLVNIPIEIDL